MANLTDELIQTIHQMDLLRLEFAALAARFAETEEYAEDGSATPGKWIEHACKLSPEDAHDFIAVGDQMPHLMASVAAVRAGRIGFDDLVDEARTRSR